LAGKENTEETMPTLMRSTALALALVAFASTADAQTPKRGGTLTFAVTSEAPTFDCHATTTYAAIHVLSPHYSLLVKIDGNNYPNIVPALAESWTISPDGLTYTFKLRAGVTFHDGSAFSSKDIKATFDRIRKPPAGIVSVRKAAFEDITAIDTPDATTVVFKLKAPDTQFLGLLALPFNCVYSAAQIEKDQNYPAKNIMGTGPFVHIEHVAGSHFVGKRYEKYFEPGKPYIDGFKAVLMKASALVPAFQGGQVQAEFRSINPGERDQLVKALGDKIVIQESPWLCKTHLLFNVKEKPFDNVKVRQALQMSIDRWGGSEALGKISIVKPVGGPIRPGDDYALSPDELAKLPGFGRDIEKSRAEARKILEEAGLKDLKFRLINRNVTHPFTPTGVYVVDQFRRIGVTAEHVQLDVSQQKKALFGGEFQVAVDAFCVDNDDPRPLMLQFLSKSRSPRNTTHGENPEIDKLYDSLKGKDKAAQKAIVAEMQRQIITSAFDVPVLWYSRIVAHSSALKGWKISPTHFANQDHSGVWLE